MAKGFGKRPPPNRPPGKVRIAAMAPSLARNSKAEALHTRAVKEAKKK